MKDNASSSPPTSSDDIDLVSEGGRILAVSIPEHLSISEIRAIEEAAGGLAPRFLIYTADRLHVEWVPVVCPSCGTRTPDGDEAAAEALAEKLRSLVRGGA